MELFWAIFWILLLIVPALWLASIIWSIAAYIFMFAIAGIIYIVNWVIEKVRGK